MRSAPFVVGLLLGLSASFFTGCPMNTCTAASCPLGCCDTKGRCQTSGNQTCGRNGATCASCSGFDTCVSGVCMGSNSGAGQATGGGFSGTGGGASGTGYAAFLTNFSNAYCQYELRCGKRSSALADCTALWRPFFADGALPNGGEAASERAVTAGYSTFNATRAQACLDGLSALSCRDPTRVLPPDCRFVTTPAAAPNAACFTDADCTDATLRCNGATCMRRCTAGGNLGEKCRRDGTCTAPFICRDSRQCSNRRPLGASCSVDWECGTGAYCSSGVVCATLPGIGSPCPDARCAAEAYCSGSQCLARKAANVACSFSSECADGLRCTTAQVCGPKGAAGAPCRDFSDCESTLACDDVLRTCRAYSSVDSGQPCSSTRSCADGPCVGKVIVFDGGTNTAGICRDPVVGDRCSNNRTCGEAKYCDMTTSTCRAAGASTPCSEAFNCLMDSYCPSSDICAKQAAAGQVCDSTRSDSCAAMGESCLPTTTPGTSRCRRAPALGEACTDGCSFPATCVAGTCVAAGRVGQPCLNVLQAVFPCFEGECVQADGGLDVRGIPASTSSTCVAPRANGSPCVADQGCQSRSCDRQGPGGAGVCAAACN
jgi:hypothetical protein